MLWNSLVLYCLLIGYWLWKLLLVSWYNKFYSIKNPGFQLIFQRFQVGFQDLTACISKLSESKFWVFMKKSMNRCIRHSSTTGNWSLKIRKTLAKMKTWWTAHTRIGVLVSEAKVHEHELQYNNYVNGWYMTVIWQQYWR